MLRRRSGPRKGPSEDLRDASAQFDFRDFLDVLKRRADLPLRFRQRHPQLRPIQNATVMAWRFFSMSNAVSRRHDVHAAGPNQTFVDSGSSAIFATATSASASRDLILARIKCWRSAILYRDRSD